MHFSTLHCSEFRNTLCSAIFLGVSKKELWETPVFQGHFQPYNPLLN